MDNKNIRLATADDRDKILSLYGSVVGMETCTWNEYYPSADEIKGDIAAGCLYVMCEGNTIIGAASEVPENELDTEGFWRVNEGYRREIARIVISPCCQRRGYGKLITAHLLTELKNKGCVAVHLLVAEINTTAFRLYRSLGFEAVGNCHMYGNDYIACELIF